MGIKKNILMNSPVSRRLVVCIRISPHDLILKTFLPKQFIQNDFDVMVHFLVEVNVNATVG